jgi:DNA-binding response OmpR family regulator
VWLALSLVQYLWVDAMNTDRIVIICDDASLAYGLSYYLKGQGYLADTVEKSAEGLEQCKAKVPDLILIHYSPLGRPPDAIALCRQLCIELAGKEVPIFMISNSREEAFHAGATEWFDLVFDIEDIARKVESHIR